MNNFRDKFRHQVSQRGFSLMEVLIGIAIFAIGMLALASLQGALTRSTAEAKVRTTAVNIAEQIIEGQRGFSEVSGGGFSYDSIDDVLIDAAIYFDGEMTRYADPPDDPVGVTYTVTQDVTDWYYDLATDAFTETAPTGAVTSDYKTVMVNVAWNDNRNFVIDENTQTGDLGGGSVGVSGTISSVSVVSAIQVSELDDSVIIAPDVSYTPGENPDIVSLSLGDNKFKESTMPVPKVIRVDELVETRFDVITYSSTGSGSVFLRREEFSGVSCECELRAAPGDAVGRRPTLWAGDEYTEAEFVDKAYGVSTNSIQSPRCETCCRDHHDGGTGSNDPADDAGAIRYDPFRASTDYWDSGTFGGDHKHYKKDRFGDLSVADSVGDVYVEACRMTRKDGFMRAAQDFRREGLNVFPYDFLDDTADVDSYSAYTTGEVETFVGLTSDGYESSPPVLTPPSRTAVGISPAPDTDLTYAYTYLPTALNADFQQLRSRGIYIDYLSEDLRAVITCLEADGSADSCKSGAVVLDQTGSVNLLEMIPFYDVQLTYLNRWTENPPNNPVDTTNEALRSDSSHSRGVASKEASVGGSQVRASGNRGVSGITDTDPIDENFLSMVTNGEIRVIVNTDNPPPPNGTVVTAVFSSGVNGVQASSVEIEASGAVCDRTVEGFICLVPNGVGATIKLSNYDKQNNKDIVACSYEVTLPGTGGTDTASRPFTIFDLDGALDSIIYQISIENVSCGG